MFGKPEDGQDLADFILSQIDDRVLINKGVEMAAKSAIDVVSTGIDYAMNKYN